jgi:hypothetical protein
LTHAAGKNPSLELVGEACNDPLKRWRGEAP